MIAYDMFRFFNETLDIEFEIGILVRSWRFTPIIIIFKLTF